MRKYYFIDQVARTEYGFTVEDLLHYGARCGIRLYAHVGGPFRICNRNDGQELEDDNFFVCLDIHQIMEIEKTHARNTAQRSMETPLVTNEKFRLVRGRIDDKYMGEVPVGHMFRTKDAEIDIAFVNTDFEPAYFSKHEIICFTADLIKLQAENARFAHVAKYGKNALPPETPKLSNTERNTLYKMILGMAIQKYGFNPESRRNTASGENKDSICADLQNAGLPVDADTIREHLKAAFIATPPEKSKPNSGKS